MILHVELYENGERLCTDFFMVDDPNEIPERCTAQINRYLKREGREKAKNPGYEIIRCYYD